MLFHHTQRKQDDHLHPLSHQLLTTLAIGKEPHMSVLNQVLFFKMKIIIVQSLPGLIVTMTVLQLNLLSKSIGQMLCILARI